MHAVRTIAFRYASANFLVHFTADCFTQISYLGRPSRLARLLWLLGLFTLIVLLRFLHLLERIRDELGVRRHHLTKRPIIAVQVNGKVLIHGLLLLHSRYGPGLDASLDPPATHDLLDLRLNDSLLILLYFDDLGYFLLDLIAGTFRFLERPFREVALDYLLFDFEAAWLRDLLLIVFEEAGGTQTLLEVFEALPVKSIELFGDFPVDGRLLGTGIAGFADVRTRVVLAGAAGAPIRYRYAG